MILISLTLENYSLLCDQALKNNHNVKFKALPISKISASFTVSISKISHYRILSNFSCVGKYIFFS